MNETPASIPPSSSFGNESRRARSNHQTLQRLVVALAGLLTFLALFYAVENWRGQRAWDRCKHDLEAQGAVLDWKAFIPPPVPDDQNFFRAPRMQEWFVGKGSNELSHHLDVGSSKASPPRGDCVAEFAFQPSAPEGASSQPNLMVRLDDPAALAQLRHTLAQAIGPHLQGAQGSYTFVARPFDPLEPLHFTVIGDHTPTGQEVTDLLAPRPGDPWPWSSRRWEIQWTGTNSFRQTFNPPRCSAADYLARTDGLETDFDLIRAALRRPQARMDGDYELPFGRPLPNYVCVRRLAQTLAQRAQCHLLLGQPEKAVTDLALMQDLGRMLEVNPPAPGLMLVAAMIHVAITGLYVETVVEGLRLETWPDPQLTRLQAQLRQINLFPEVLVALRSERAAVCRTFETLDQSKNLARILGDQPSPLRFAKFAPRGWAYQNMAFIARSLQTMEAGFDLTNQVVHPGQLGTIARQIEVGVNHFSPYMFLASVATANFARAIQTMARTQTVVNETLVGIALERYRLAQGCYPETLASLVPAFLDEIPADIITGQPLKYRRTADGKSLLYSVGWNETDDGGQIARLPGGAEDRDRGDWVWSRWSDN